MILYDLQMLIFRKIDVGEFGPYEFAGFLCSKHDSPLQVILRHRQTGTAKIIDINADDGSVVLGDPPPKTSDASQEEPVPH